MVYQLGAALLDACVLAILAHRDSYGYELTIRIKNVMNISESTLYPVLRRLQKDELLTTYDKEYQGRNRRYYKITSAGKARFIFYRGEWQSFKRLVDGVMEGDSDHD